ncbi:MAG: hypothetical protein ACRDJ5_03035 [Actinomycetota bacterium]
MRTGTAKDPDALAGPPRQRGPGFATLRRDAWWAPTLVTLVVLLGFVVYGTWVAFANENYFADPYLSPFYSPCLASNCAHVTLPVIGDWWTLSPALLVLPFPLGFRLTCYYYRKAYYRGFWLSPPACAVTEPHRRYTGETRFPLILQNIHRYFFYAAIPFPIILFIDGIRAFFFEDGFGMGLGTLILLTNAVLLGAYTLSCHSCRHLCGGHVDTFSRSPKRFKFWRLVSKLNLRHAEIAWVSLFGVALTDVYVRLVAMGVIDDPRFF